MLTCDPAEFLAAFDAERLPPRAPATARGAFLVSPLGFSLAAESARDNHYMDLARRPDPARALQQHAELARRLAAELPVVTFPGDPQAPDGVFPNNAFATAPGRLIVGRMRHPVRQRETRRADIRAWFRDVLGYATVDLSALDGVAELTGSLVIDRARGVGFCGLSERCDLAGARAMHAAFGLRLTFCFALAAGEYHTNVVMALLAGRALMLAADGFADPAVPAAIARAYADAVVWLDPAQKRAYAGNAITLGPASVWLSRAAADSLDDAQHARLARQGFALATAELDEIEAAGGSLRCCVGEVY